MWGLLDKYACLLPGICIRLSKDINFQNYPAKQLYANKMDNLEEMNRFLEVQPSKIEQERNRECEETNDKYCKTVT